MALKTYNGTNWDDMVGSAAISNLTTNVTFAGVSTTGFTAPNLVNKANGAWINIASEQSVSNSGNLIIELLESGVVKATGTINFADTVRGLNYVRFTTPYTWATLTASAYTIRVRNSVSSGSLGQLRNASSGMWSLVTYDTATTLGTTDDAWVGGFHNAGLTTKTLTLSGTSNQFGSGTEKGINSNTIVSMGCGLTIGAGGTVVFDQSASTTLQIRGSIFVGRGGVFDARASSDKSRIQKLIFDCETADGNYMLLVPSTGYGGKVYTTGATYDVATTYASGLGTAASPMIVQTGWDADVGDEVIIGGGTDYAKNELRYIKTRNSSTSFVLCSTPGGAEAALVNTHAVGSHMANMTRNVVFTSLTTTRGYYLFNGADSNSTGSSFDYTRFEYSSCVSGRGITTTNNLNAGTANGTVFYNSSGAGRGTFLASGITVSTTFSSLVLYNQQGSNFSGQSGIQVQSTSNCVFNNCLAFNAPGATTNCGFISLIVTAVNNTFNNCHAYGANAVNSAAGYAIGVFSSSGNTFNNCTVNGTRQNAVYLASGSTNIFNNCNFGAMASNTIDVQNLASSLNTAIFNNCTFASATLIAGYASLLEGSLIGFQNHNGGSTSHRWYTNHGSGWSAGSGLTDTTVRTASSLSLVLKPEDATSGQSWVHNIPANAETNVFENGYVYRNGTFSSGTVKIEMWLPGTSLASSPDTSYTFPTTTGQWLPYLISAYYSGSVSGLATVKITAITATAGAYLFIDDLYDAQLNNKLAGIDIWLDGQPSKLIAAVDASAVPGLVWNYPTSPTTSGTMGESQSKSYKLAKFIRNSIV